MEEIKRICSKLNFRDFVYHVAEAKCEKNDLEEASTEIELFTQMFEPIAQSISSSLITGKDLLETINGDLEKLEVYEQEQEECIEELAQLVQDEDNKHRQLQERIMDLDFDNSSHENFINFLKSKTVEIEKETVFYNKELKQAQLDVSSIRDVLVEVTQNTASLEQKSRTYEELIKTSKNKLENLRKTYETFQLQLEEGQNEYLNFCALLKEKEDNKRRAEEEAQRKIEEELKQKEEEAKLKAEEEEKRKVEEEERKAEEERRKAEEEERKAEEERRKAEEEERKAEEEKLKAEEEKKRIALEEQLFSAKEEETRKRKILEQSSIFELEEDEEEPFTSYKEQKKLGRKSKSAERKRVAEERKKLTAIEKKKKTEEKKNKRRDNKRRRVDWSESPVKVSEEATVAIQSTDSLECATEKTAFPPTQSTPILSQKTKTSQMSSTSADKLSLSTPPSTLNLKQRASLIFSTEKNSNKLSATPTQNRLNTQRPVPPTPISNNQILQNAKISATPTNTQRSMNYSTPFMRNKQIHQIIASKTMNESTLNRTVDSEDEDFVLDDW